MKERPILFSGPMVRAIISGHKTETRRIIKIPPALHVRGPILDARNPYYTRGSGQYPGGCPTYTGDQPPGFSFSCADNTRQQVPCPYGVPGDLLWVRETHAIVDGPAWSGLPCTPGPDGRWAYYREGFDRQQPRWRPSIYMPRWASRLQLQVEEVRVERLQAITGAGVLAEGVGQPWNGRGIEAAGGMTDEHEADLCAVFSRGWDSINGERWPWRNNPFVWVVRFCVRAGGGR